MNVTQEEVFHHTTFQQAAAKIPIERVEQKITLELK